MPPPCRRYTPTLKPSFTAVSLGACACSALPGAGRLWPTAACLVWGVMASFAMVRVVEPTSYARMAAAHGWSMRTFHAGNVVLHVVPALAVLASPPRATTWRDGAAGAAVYTAWMWSVGGIRGLARMYVPLPERAWYACIATMYAAIVSTALALAGCQAGGDGRPTAG